MTTGPSAQSFNIPRPVQPRATPDYLLCAQTNRTFPEKNIKCPPLFSETVRKITSNESPCLRSHRLMRLLCAVPTHYSNQLTAQLEKDRQEIANLQDRVRRLVARR